MSGNAKVNTTADGLRIMERKLAFARASVAFVWLYGGCILFSLEDGK